MDLKVYYQKLRQVEGSIAEPDVVVASLGTPDGGRAGVLTEVPRALAAKLIVEGGARLATEEETLRFREQVAEAKRLAEEAAAASRIQVTVVSEPREDGKRQKAKGKTGQE
jgi:lysophospholipase L1-like esterase